MKILIIHSNGIHDKNRHYRECFCLQRSFAKLNHICDIYGQGHLLSDPDYNSYDIILNCENYGNNWIPNLSIYTKPLKLFWAIDAHCTGEQNVEWIYKNHGYNYILHSTKTFVKRPHHIWTPNCFDDSLIHPLPDIKKEYSIGYCGTYGPSQREYLVKTLKDKVSLKDDIFVIGDDMVRAINSYHIHFNYNIRGDINYRNFETIGCNTMLLTSYDYAQYDALGFKNFENFIYYVSEYDLLNKVKLLQNNPDLIKKISNAGYELSKNYTYDKFVERLLKI